MLATALPRGDVFGARLVAVAIDHLRGWGRPDLQFGPKDTLQLARELETPDTSIMHVTACIREDDGTSLHFQAVVFEGGQYANATVVITLTIAGIAERWEGRMRQTGAGFIEIVTLVPAPPA